jgi:hypothetical protein
MVCALLGLAVAVLYDVARAPGPVTLVETPVLIVGLDRLRKMAEPPGHALALQPPGEPALLPRLTRGGHGTPTFFLDLTDVTGEVELPARKSPQVTVLPSVIIEGAESVDG